MNQNVQPLIGFLTTPSSVPVANGALKTTSGSMIEGDFFARLQVLLQREQSDELNMSHPAILISVFASLLGTEEWQHVDLHKLAARWMEAFENNLDPSQQSSILQSEELAAWLTGTMQIIDALPRSTATSLSTTSFSESHRGMHTDSSTLLQHLQRTIYALLDAIRMYPQHEALIQQQNKLKDMLGNFVLTLEPAGKEIQAQLTTGTAKQLAQAIIQGNELPLWAQRHFHTMLNRLDHAPISSMKPIISNEVHSGSAAPITPHFHPTLNWTSLWRTNSTVVSSAMVMEASLNQGFSDTIPVTMNENLIQTMTPAEIVRMFGNETPQVMKSLHTSIPSKQLLEHLEPLLVKHMKIAQQLNGVSEARITLVPEHLGQVDIRITMQNGQLVAQFMAETLMGKELLESQLVQLRAALQNQGIQVEKLEVSQQNNAQFSMFQESRHQQAQQFVQQNKQKSVNVERIQQELSLEYDEHEVHHSVLAGNSFHAMA